MDGFIKAIGLCLTAAFLCIALSGQAKQYAAFIVLAVLGIVGVLSLSYIEPVISFFKTLQAKSGWNAELMEVLLKAVGIGILSDIAVLICNDSGQASFGKVIGMLASAVMLWLSLPLFSSLLELVGNILNGI